MGVWTGAGCRWLVDSQFLSFSCVENVTLTTPPPPPHPAWPAPPRPAPQPTAEEQALREEGVQLEELQAALLVLSRRADDLVSGWVDGQGGWGAARWLGARVPRLTASLSAPPG